MSSLEQLSAEATEALRDAEQHGAVRAATFLRVALPEIFRHARRSDCRECEHHPTDATTDAETDRA